MEDETIVPAAVNDPMPEFKKVSLLVSSYLVVILVLRYACVVILHALAAAVRDTMSFDTLYLIEIAISATFLQIIPSVVGAFMFGYLGKNGRGLRCLYTIPKSTGRAISDFNAVYGIAQAANIITIIVMLIITSNADIVQEANSVADSMTSLPTAIGMFILLTVIAPVFEEFIFRGLILNALRPYGRAFSIFMTGILFGLYHGNFQQFFYAAAGGIAMSYIAYVTKTTFPTTVIHFIINLIGGILLLLMNTDPVQRYIIRGDSSAISDDEMIWVAIYAIFIICVLLLALVGMIMAVIKTRQIIRHKTPKVWGEVSDAKKITVMMLSVPAVITVVMLIDTFGGFSKAMIADFFGIG